MMAVRCDTCIALLLCSMNTHQFSHDFLHQTLGQLGDGTFNDSFGSRVDFPSSASEVVYVASGPSAESVFYITDDGEVYGNGYNDRGQLGIGDDSIDSTNVPVKVDFPNSADIGHISASSSHTTGW